MNGGGGVIIYVDILLAVNGWADFLLLLGVRRACGIGARGWRLVLGAFIGALSSCVLLLPALSAWLTLSIKLLTAVLMVLTAYGWYSYRRFGKALLLLFGLSAGLSGLCSALYYFVAPRDFYVFNGVVYYNVSPWLLIGLTLVCYGVLTLLERVSRRRAPTQRDFVVRLSQDNRTVQVRCLYDSGNHLTEPFSNQPVLVVERAAIERFVSVPSVDALPPNGRWRVVPFDSLGGSGMLPAFKPQSVAVFVGREERTVSDCYVAVCERLGRGEYQGLIGTSLGDRLI